VANERLIAVMMRQRKREIANATPASGRRS
jgi:hypothetical protein